MMDFEQALINAIKTFLPNVIREGCFFHFGQLCNTHLQNEGLQAISSVRDSTLNVLLRKIKALGFLPPDEVFNAYSNFIKPDLANQALINADPSLGPYIDRIAVFTGEWSSWQ